MHTHTYTTIQLAKVFFLDLMVDWYVTWIMGMTLNAGMSLGMSNFTVWTEHDTLCFLGR